MSYSDETPIVGADSAAVHISISEPTTSRHHSTSGLYHQMVMQERKLMERQGHTRFRRFFQRQMEKIKLALAEMEEDLAERREAQALSRKAQNSRLALLTAPNSSTLHLRNPSLRSATTTTTTIGSHIESSNLIRIVSHVSLTPPSPRHLSTASLTFPTPPSSSSATTTAALAAALGARSLHDEMLQQNGPEEGGSLLLLKRLQTKLFRRISWSSGEEEFVEIKEEEEEGEGREGERVIRKKVDFVWGKGVDEII